MSFSPQAVLNGPLLGMDFALSHGLITKPFGHSVTAPPSIGIYSEFPDCGSPPLKDNLVCNSSAPWLDRAKAVVDLFTSDELVSNLGNTASGNPRIGLPPYQWWGEALHGVAICPAVTFENSGEWAYATSFPQPINLGAAFDDDLVHQVATIISTESRAFSNGKHAGINFWTPNINPFRDPRWGRGQEVAGEDALHLARYVYSLVTGLQGPDAPNYYKVVSACKHYAGYDLDQWNGMDRFHFDAQISTQDLAEYHMLPFRSCVRDAQVGSVMCSYNAVNGIPTCANPYFLQDILRDEWGFGEGWVTGDCDAVLHIWLSHGYASYEQAAAVALKAGTDTDCGMISQATLSNALANGWVTMDDLKKSVIRLYGSLVRTGYFDPPEKQPYINLGWGDVNTPEAQALALHAAESSVVLLKNDGLLPLAVDKYKSVALIGPEGDATQDMQGNYIGVAPFLISPLQGLKDAGFDVNFVRGTDGIQGDNTDGFEAAIDAAKAADVIIFAGGINNQVEAEAFDRMSITYPGKQLDLLRQLATLGKPIVVLQFGGGQVDDTEIKANANINALLWVGYLGQSGGTAISNIVTGKVAPAGRLTSTQYPGAFTALPMTDMNLRPTDSSPGRTYKWYTGETVYEFGYGLHYTTFNVSWAEPVPATFDIASVTNQQTTKFLDNEALHSFKVAITNTGKVTSDYVALLFVRSTAGPQPAPLKSLIGYARARKIAPGATTTVDIAVTLGAISRADEKGSFLLSPGTYDLELDTTAVLKGSFELTGEEKTITDFPQPR